MNARRFTLVELLTVIVIIMILIGILMPTISIVIRKAEENQSKVRMKTLITAIKQYESQYGVLPVVSPAASGDDAIFQGSDNPRLISLLTGITDASGTLGSSNTRGIRFLEPTDPKSPNNYVDAWGKPFLIALDANYDGQIDASAIESATTPIHGKTGSMYSSVLIWSSGPDEKYDNSTSAGGQNSDNIYSWE